MMPLWERYFLKEAVKAFAFFLGCFFVLYSLLDYSLHMQDFIKDKQIQFVDIFIYYYHQFIKRAALLIPLTLLITTIKLLTTFNERRELVALQTAGISSKRLLRPFFIVALGCTLFSFANIQFLLPASLRYADQFHANHFRHSFYGERKEPMHVLTLKDNSKLVYQKYDAMKDVFFDVIWIRSADDIWRIKTLKADPKKPQGKYVDHLTRNGQGIIEKNGSYESYIFEEVRWNPSAMQQGSIPFENRKWTDLYHLLREKRNTPSYEKSEILTQVLFKSVMPVLPILCVIAVAPVCIRYARRLPLFFLYAFSLFAFLAFYAFMDAATILGENHLVTPFTAILVPFFSLSSFFMWKFLKMR